MLVHRTLFDERKCDIILLISVNMYKSSILILFNLPVSVVAFSGASSSIVGSALKECCNNVVIFRSGDIVQGLSSVILSSSNGILEVQSITPMDVNSDNNPALETAGQGFFLVYVVFSLFAGGKEFLTRLQTWAANKKRYK